MRGLAVVFLLLALAAAVWAVLAYRSQRRYLATAMRAIGVIQSVTAERGEKGATYYLPVIQFKTAEGATVTQTSKSGRNTPYRIGDPIQVIYDPDHPENLELDTFWSRWLVVMAAVFLAFVCLAIAGGLLGGSTPQG